MTRPGSYSSRSYPHETCPTEDSPQCIDTPANPAGPASYSAEEGADGGNIVGDGTGVSREHTTDALSNEAHASEEDNSGRLEQEGRRGPQAISTSTQKPSGPVDRRRRMDKPEPLDDLTLDHQSLLGRQSIEHCLPR